MISVTSQLRFVCYIVATVAVLAAGSPAYAEPPPSPTVIGPIPVNSTPGAGSKRDYIYFTAEPYFDLRAAGYYEEEFFIQGQATRYETPDLADGVEVSKGHSYKTSIRVRRPIDPAKFNGVVLVEWVNVTSGYGVDLHWQYSREYLTRAGYVHVGLQAQRVGVHNPEGLKNWSPVRYSSLDVTDNGKITDDSLSYDILSQAVMAMKGQSKAQILGTLEPKAFFAVGQSQSAGRLTRYYNSIQPLHKVIDGFLLQVSGGPFRTDISAPMIQVMSENEVSRTERGFAARRQPDSSTLRTWEIAGAAHVAYWWVMHRQALAYRDGVTPPSLACEPEPASHVPLRYVLNAGYHHLSRWVLDKVEPPHGTPIQVTSLDPVVLPRDANGLSFGGIRQAEVVAPTATNRGDQVGMTPGCSGSYGMHIPFSDEKLKQLYPTHDAYVRAVTQAVNDNVRDGFILEDDAAEIIKRAENSPVGTGRPVPVH